MATSPASPPNHSDLINHTNPPHDDYDDVDSPPALHDVRAVRLSYEASPTSKVRKAVSHATPPTGGRSPRRRSRRIGDAVSWAVEFAPIINDRPVTTYCPSLIDKPSPTATNDPALISLSQISSPLESLSPIAALTASAAASTLVNIKRTKKKKPSSLQTNRKAVLNNDIFTFSRPNVFDKDDMVVDAEEFHDFYRHFLGQVRVRFQEVRETKKTRDDKMGGRASRSTIAESDLFDDDAVELSTTNQKRLSRCHWEDMLRYLPGQKLAIYFRNDPELLNDTFNKVPNKAKLIQKKKGIGGQFVTIASQKFIVLKATIVLAPAHIDCQAGMVSSSQLADFYKFDSGFTLAFDDTTEKLAFSWKDVQNLAEDVYFFGPPVNGARRYENIFYHKHRIDYCQHVASPSQVRT